MKTPSSSSDARATAAAWVARLDAGLTPAEVAEFAAWRASHPSREAAAVAAEHTHALLSRLAESTAADDLRREAEQLISARERAPRLRRWRWAPALAMAACVALVAAYWTLRPQDQTGTVALAETTRTLDLADGSTLRLQAGSVVAVHLGTSERRVELREGTVHFSVAKDSARPFVVAAGSVQVRAVGTAFEVAVAAGGVRVDVTEGRVEVTRADSTSEPARYLIAGQGLSFGASSGDPTGVARLVPDAVDTVPTAARLVFDHTPLSEVVSQFSRRSSLQIEIADPALANRPVGGTFDADQAESFVKLLESVGDVRVERVSETHIILHRAQ